MFSRDEVFLVEKGLCCSVQYSHNGEHLKRPPTPIMINIYKILQKYFFFLPLSIFHKHRIKEIFELANTLWLFS